MSYSKNGLERQLIRNPASVDTDAPWTLIVTGPFFIFLSIFTEIADNHGDAGDCHDAVVTVPLHFTDKQRQAVRTCAEKGGFNLLRIIDETSAAVLAYDIGQHNHHEDWWVM